MADATYFVNTVDPDTGETRLILVQQESRLDITPLKVQHIAERGLDVTDTAFHEPYTDCEDIADQGDG